MGDDRLHEDRAMVETPDRTESIFAAAIALATAGERVALLDRECVGDQALRGRVEALLRAHDRAGHLLDLPVPGSPEQTAGHIPGEQPGTIIAGRYKLLEAIGEGGMGTVWVAEQTQPVRRKVALKLIKAGMDSKSVLARFEAERQALAVMDHPNIAKVLDGGLTETGRPFFVMEYVKAVPITEYCDATRLSVPERLNLFGQVCAAVQHAHQKGIIHRDLKPSNILVAPYDDKPVPKVIDFGLAKAMHQSLTERTLHTAHETVLGTPLYMSPEQAQLNNLDVDTRSDIYSLGVLLYELLTGTTPLEKKRFKEAAWDEIKRIIREEEAPRPSMRLSSSQALPLLAASRHTEPARLTKLVRGELDWIVMKALDKDRTRRYSTASEFAADITRHLHDEPVLAGPPRVTYRLRKFLRKHHSAVTAVALVVLALLIGLGASLTLYFQAEEARQAADEARTAEEWKTRELGAALQEKAATVNKEKEARLDADKSRWLAERRLYGAGVLLAKSAFDQLQVGQARRALDGTEPSLRGWEWRYLDRAIDTSRRTLHPGHDVAWNLRFAADGKTLAWVTVWSKKSADQKLLATMGLGTRSKIPLFPAMPAGCGGGIDTPDTKTREHTMRFVLQPWQLLLSIVAGWINDEQQKIIEYQRTVIQVLRENMGNHRVLLNDDQRRLLAVKGKILGHEVLAQVGAALHAGYHSAAPAPGTGGPEMGPQRPASLR